MIPGWMESKGMALEVDVAIELEKPMKYIMMHEMPSKDSVYAENKTYQEPVFIPKK
jgi:hypothetical protein